MPQILVQLYAYVLTVHLHVIMSTALVLHEAVLICGHYNVLAWNYTRDQSNTVKCIHRLVFECV